nr:hypothetical protein [Tanacetum cinerariifolium]
MNELVGLVSRVVQLMETSTPHVNATGEWEKEAPTNKDISDIHPDTITIENPAPAQGEQQPNGFSNGQNTIALVVQSTVAQHEAPLTKRLKIVMGIHTIPTHVPMNSIRPTVLDNILFKQFSANLFRSSPSQHTPIPPPNKPDKGTGIAQSTNDDALKKIMDFIEEEGPSLSLSSLKHFNTAEEGPMTHEEAHLQL